MLLVADYSCSQWTDTRFLRRAILADADDPRIYTHGVFNTLPRHKAELAVKPLHLVSILLATRRCTTALKGLHPEGGGGCSFGLPPRLQLASPPANTAASTFNLEHRMATSNQTASNPVAGVLAEGTFNCFTKD